MKCQSLALAESPAENGNIWYRKLQVTRQERGKHDVKEEKTKDRYHNNKTLGPVDMGNKRLSPHAHECTCKSCCSTQRHVHTYLSDFSS